MADERDNLVVAIARIEEQLKAAKAREQRMADDLHALRAHIEKNYVHVETLKPIQRIGYALGLGFATIISGAVASLIIKQ